MSDLVWKFERNIIELSQNRMGKHLEWTRVWITLQWARLPHDIVRVGGYNDIAQEL